MFLWEDEVEGVRVVGTSAESVAAILDGTRSANATSGWGSIAIELNDDSVAPWKLRFCSWCRCECRGICEWVCAAAGWVCDGECPGGMKEVTTATG